MTCPAMKIVREAPALCRCGAVQQGLNFRPEAVITHKLVIQTAYCVRTAVYVGWSRNAGFWPLEGLSLALAPQVWAKCGVKYAIAHGRKGLLTIQFDNAIQGNQQTSRSVTDNWSSFNFLGICILGEYKASTLRDPFPLSLLNISFLQAVPDR